MRELRAACEEHGTAYFLKQLGAVPVIAGTRLSYSIATGGTGTNGKTTYACEARVALSPHAASLFGTAGVTDTALTPTDPASSEAACHHDDPDEDTPAANEEEFIGDIDDRYEPTDEERRLLEACSTVGRALEMRAEVIADAAEPRHVVCISLGSPRRHYPPSRSSAVVVASVDAKPAATQSVAAKVRARRTRILVGRRPLMHKRPK